MANSHSTPLRGPKGRAPRAPQVTISVTKEIIDTAIRRDSKNCMIAETIAATVPNARNILVDTSTIRWSDRDKGLRYTYQTPTIVRDSIFKFDFGHEVEPFSFLLRGAWVSGIRGSRETKRIPLANWEKIKEDVRDLREKRGLEWTEVANEMGIVPSTLGSKLSLNAPPPGLANIDKIESWVLKQTGEKPAPRVNTQAHQVAGPMRVRSEKRKNPELIGGRPPTTPANMTLRQYGLRAFDWKMEK